MTDPYNAPFHSPIAFFTSSVFNFKPDKKNIRNTLIFDILIYSFFGIIPLHAEPIIGTDQPNATPIKSHNGKWYFNNNFLVFSDTMLMRPMMTIISVFVYDSDTYCRLRVRKLS